MSKASKLKLVHDRDLLSVEDIAADLQNQLSARAKSRLDAHQYECRKSIVRINLRDMIELGGIQEAATDIAKLLEELSRK